MLDKFECERTESVHVNDEVIDLHFVHGGNGQSFIHLHGWGVTHHTFQPLAELLFDQGSHTLIDFPGFGKTNRPQASWGTEEYAECIQQFIRQNNHEPLIAIGHSFGGRVAIRMANRWPELFRGIVLIASAGLKRKVPLKRKVRIKTIQTAARFAKQCLPGSLGESVKQSLYRRIASQDYLNAGDMRDIFVRVVNEDLSPLLPHISVPALLIWGQDDTETPPEFGKRMKQLIPQSTYIELPEFDHYSILTRGRHQVAHQIKKFAKHLEEG